MPCGFYGDAPRRTVSGIELYIQDSIRYIALGRPRVGADLLDVYGCQSLQLGLAVQRESRMSENHRNRMPAYKRIQREIRDRIASDALKPGDAVASERELAKTHKVSLMTARHALAGLEHEGIVERRLGAGTFVAVPRIHFNKLMSYTEQMSSRGLAPRSRVLAAKVVEGEPEIAARLGLPETSRLIKIQRLRLTHEEPFALETCYLPATDFPHLVSAPLGRSSLFAILEHDYATKLAYADEEVDATSADASVAEMLSVPRGSSLLRIRQTIYSVKGKATIYGVGFYRSERHSLFIRRLR
jgi:GntR family transcriptional regulator